MKPAIPWSVKGVEPETREAAKAAAKRAGMTLGQWLNQMIRDQGEEMAPPRRPLTLVQNAQEDTEEGGELSVVLERLEALETHQNEAIQHLEHALEMLASRVPPPGQGGVPAALEPRLAQLEAESKRRFERLGRELGMIANRYGDLEERQEHARQELTRMMENLAEAPPPAGAKPADQALVAHLEKRLKTMEARLEAVGRDGRNAATTFQQALSAVMGRVVEGESRQRDQASRFESKLDGLAERLEDMLAREGAGENESIARLEQMVGAVTRQFEVVESRRERSHLAMEKTLRGLAERLAETDRRHAQTVEEPLATLNAAVAEMSKRIAETSGALETRLADVTERIEHGDTEFRASRFSMMHGLDETRRRLEALEAGGPALPPLVDEPPSRAEDDTHAMRGERTLSALFRRPEPAFERTAPAEPPAPETPPPPAAEEAPPLALDVVEERAPQETPPHEADPVGALLAAAREAARARQPREAADFVDAENVDATFTVAAPDAGSGETRQAGWGSRTRRRAAQREAKLDAKLDKGRAPKVALAVLIAAGVIAAGVAGLLWASQRAKAPGERPGLVQSLLSDGSSAYLYERGGKETVLAPTQSAPHAGEPAPMPADAAPEEPAPAAEAPAAPAEAADEFAPPPEPANTQELAALATSAIAQVRNAATPEAMAQAAQKLTQAAMLGDGEAQFTLGRLYETGQGVSTDPAAARHWYEEAAAQGHAGAAFNIGMMEAKTGTSDAYARAAQWFEHAAQKGYADAQYNLAMLYARGLGVARDDVEAYGWFAAAAAHGDQASAAERDRLFDGFDEATRTRAEALARTRVQS